MIVEREYSKSPICSHKKIVELLDKDLEAMQQPRYEVTKHSKRQHPATKGGVNIYPKQTLHKRGIEHLEPDNLKANSTDVILAVMQRHPCVHHRR